MSGRVAYLERTDRGFRPGGLRLVTERSSEQIAFVLDAPDADRPELTRGAEWIRERIPRGPAGLDVLCLDIDGSLCSWLSSPSAEPGVVAALARQGGSGGWSGGEEASPAGDILGGYAGLAQESSLQALAVAEAPARRPKNAKNAPARETARQRLAVVATPDATARVLLDELDLRTVRVGSVCSLWHAMSAAWDPSGTVHARAVGKAPDLHPDRVVADSPAVHATVLIDSRGRLLWSWSGRGGLMAGGSIRLRHAPAGPDESPTPQVRRSDVSRLAAEWLSWSAQLGAAPARVTCVLPDLAAAEGALDAPALGEAIGKAWPGAAIDVAIDEDPLGATLRRIAVAGSAAQDAGEPSPLSPADPSNSLIALTHRPGRAHFRLYLWSALTLAVAAAGIAVVALQLWISASKTRLAATKTGEQWRQSFQDLRLPAAFPGQEIIALETELARLERNIRPVAPAEPAMPVLQELDTLSYVIGFDGVHLEEITLDSRFVKPRIVCQVASIPVGEALFTALKQVADSNVTGWTSSYAAMPNGKTKCTFNGSWVTQARPAPGGGT